MRNLSIFAAFTPRTILLIAVAVFFIAIVVHCKYGLSTPYGYCTAKSVIVLGGTRVVQPFFCTHIPTSNFSFMPRTMKNVSKANNSNLTSTDSHETASTISSSLEKKIADLQRQVDFWKKQADFFNDSYLWALNLINQHVTIQNNAIKKQYPVKLVVLKPKKSTV